jgi:fatty-acyl-CoA synthase
MALSHTCGATSTPLLDETIDANLARTVARWGDRDAVVVRHQDIRWTYAELDEHIDRVARGLLASGIGVGDRVGLWSPNRYEWVLVQYATARIGAIMVCLNPAYRAAELRYALNQSGCRLLLAAPSFRTGDYVATWNEVADDCPDVTAAVFFDSPEWSGLLSRADEVPAGAARDRSAALDPDDSINIQYTSGTTGLPKGATLTHRNILNNGYLTGEVCGYGEADRVCVPVPFYHCFGMVLGNLAVTSHGACLVVPGEAFDPVSVLEAVEAERATSLYGVPTMFIAELGVPDFDDYDLSSLRTGIMAGSPCPVEVMRRVIDVMHMGQVTIAYGMTETSPVSAQTLPDDPMDKRVGTVGRVHPHVEIRVTDPVTGEVVPRGAEGELHTRGYSVMKGYWNDSERTAEAIDDDGWMHTGDVAVMDDEGYVAITGRIKDIVIRGGENISPREVEEFLYTHPDIVDIQVVGVPDPRFGEELCAFVSTKPGTRVDADAVRAFCEGRIAGFKIPRYVITVDEFPMTVTGKIRKYRLREMAAETLGLDGGG